jgi:hypothetical protein
MISKKAQEEMLGFGLIVIIISVIILIFVSFALKSNRGDIQESYEINSFVQVLLQYTTDCEDNLEFLKTQRLIFHCAEERKCLDERDSCEVLDETIDSIMKEVWRIENRPEKGYSLLIVSNEGVLVNLEEGNVTNNFGYGVQSFSRSGNNINITLRVYY